MACQASIAIRRCFIKGELLRVPQGLLDARD